MNKRLQDAINENLKSLEGRLEELLDKKEMIGLTAEEMEEYRTLDNEYSGWCESSYFFVEE